MRVWRGGMFMCFLLQQPRLWKKLCMCWSGKVGPRLGQQGVVQSEIRVRTMKAFLHSENPKVGSGLSETNRGREVKICHPAEILQKWGHWPWSLKVWGPDLPLLFNRSLGHSKSWISFLLLGWLWGSSETIYLKVLFLQLSKINYLFTSFAFDFWLLPKVQNFLQDSSLFVLEKEPNIPWARYKYDQILMCSGDHPEARGQIAETSGALYFMTLWFPSRLAFFLLCHQHLVSQTSPLPGWLQSPSSLDPCRPAAVVQGQPCVLLSIWMKPPGLGQYKACTTETGRPSWEDFGTLIQVFPPCSVHQSGRALGR